MHYITQCIILKFLNPCTKVVCKQDGKFYKDLAYYNCYTIYYDKNGTVYKVKKTWFKIKKIF